MYIKQCYGYGFIPVILCSYIWMEIHAHIIEMKIYTAYTCHLIMNLHVKCYGITHRVSDLLSDVTCFGHAKNLLKENSDSLFEYTF